MLLLIIVTIVMLFAAITSAYIVRANDYGWYNLKLPVAFTISTVAIILSSITFQVAVGAAKREKNALYTQLMWLTLALGFVFLTFQVIGWQNTELDLGGTNSNPSSSFMYVISGAHAVHLVTGIVYLVVTIGKTVGRPERIKEKKPMIEMCATYWHFLDALWIYLFIFLSLN